MHSTCSYLEEYLEAVTDAECDGTDNSGHP